MLIVIAGTIFADSNSKLSSFKNKNVQPCGISNVERVIFAEAAAECSNNERAYIAEVIHNRVNHEGFKFKHPFPQNIEGKSKPRMCKSHDEVVISKGEFTVFLSKKNKNWELTETVGNIVTMDAKQKAAWLNSISLARTIKGRLWKPHKYKVNPKTKDICFFISKDKSGKVSSKYEKRLLENKYWNIEKAFETEHFVFYKVVEEA